MLYLLKINFFLILNFLTISFSFSQKAPIKFGKIDIKDLEMKVYDKDSSASAVILFDYGYFNSNDFVFTRIMRIKILKKEGYKWANQIFSVPSKSEIDCITYNLENGKIAKTKLESSSIFKDRITENKYNIRVAMPNVKEGSVIDYKICYRSIPQEWHFQSTIPVAWSELVIEPSVYVIFQKKLVGYAGLSFDSENRWIAFDMPAFKVEPYLNSIENYITKLEFDVSNITFPGFYYKSIANSWNSISTLLMENRYFGLTLSYKAFIKNTVKEIEKTALTTEDKVKVAFQIIKKIKWNGIQTLFSSSEILGTTFDKKLGNSADINLTLLLLLNKLGVEAYPIVLSTRNNGMISPIYPSLNKLDHIIVSVMIDNKSILLDATEEYAPYDLLPEKNLNYHGRLLKKDEAIKIDIKADKMEKELFYYQLILKNDMSLVGNINCIRTDYAALNFRKKFHSFNSTEDYIDNFRENKTGLKIINSKFENMDSLNLPIKDSYEIALDNQISQIGNELFLNPNFFEQIKGNPFNLDERKYPISFPYYKEKTVIVSIVLPDSIELIDMPKPINLQMPNNKASFSYQINLTNNQLLLKYKININDEVFPQNEYVYLKEFYNQIIKKHSELVIIKFKD